MAETLKETNAIQTQTIEKQTIVGDSVIKAARAMQEARYGDGT